MSTAKGSVLVTGGAGFIGSHVCGAYVDAGWSVTALDDLSSGSRENVPDGVELIEADVRSVEAAELMEERCFDIVNHHAAQIDVRVSVERPDHDASVNIQGLLNLLEAARASSVRRFVFVSSGGVVYGEPDELPVPEIAPKAPLSPYGVSKLAGEHYLYFYNKVHGLEAVTLRYSNVYGPRQDPHGEAGVVAIFSRRLLENRPLIIYGDGEQTRDYVYVGDVARANLLASEAPLVDPTCIDDVAFNVGTGKETTVSDLAEVLMEVSGRSCEVKWAEARPGELSRSSLDAGKLAALGWQSEHDLARGLTLTFAHIAGQA
jgi:UDP-glucose 4-epimerase